MSKGVIYILTNPSFPDYIKIGYAKNLERRLQQLNRSETIPFAFRAYAVYEVESALTDKELHKLIDRLNPDLRSIETFDGRERVKEFYAMSAEDAYSLLESIAKISGTQERLKRVQPEGHEIIDEQIAEEVREEARRGPFGSVNAGFLSVRKSFLLTMNPSAPRWLMTGILSITARPHRCLRWRRS